MRLSVESEGQSIFDTDTLQDDLDEEMRTSVVKNLSQGKPVAFTFENEDASSKEISHFYTEIKDYLENRGFDPGIVFKGYSDGHGNTTKSVLLITPRR